MTGVLPLSWAQTATTIVAAFLASLVECVEALTVILAVGTVRGWRSALAGAALALAVLGLLVALLGPQLSRIPLHLIQLGVGTLVLLFGLRWLRKSILRAAGRIPLHDEEAAFAKNTSAMRSGAAHTGGLDRVAVAATFHISMLEGTEVVFLVIALGAGRAGLLLPASIGAVIALAVVAGLGVALHRPLARVPENSLKFAVGVLLAGFGTFWVAEGAGFTWPGNDFAIPALVAGYLVIALALAAAAREPAIQVRS